MNKMRRAMRIVSLILVCTFLGTAGFLGFTVYSQGSRWVTNRYNTRLSSAKKTVQMGDILDRKGIVLATTDSEGERKYSSDKVLRRAMSQTVGDQYSMSGTGVETFHAGTLLGVSGSIIDRTWQFITGSNYKGNDIRLTVSAELTEYIAEAFPSKKQGAVVVLNHKTGEILAMVSKPDYDPKSVSNRKNDESDAGSAYLNRCLQGQYPPGSVFKIVTLAAALENLPNVTERKFYCNGPRAFGNGRVTCFGGAEHGELSLQKAFYESCNVTFASLAYEIGDKALVRKAEQMGFNDNFSFKELVLYQSSIPGSITDESELAWTGVGQGKLLVTPMHMALIAGAVANSGVMKEPQLIAQVTGNTGLPHLRTAAGTYGRILSGKTAAVIDRYMQKTVESGTASGAKIKGYTVCGKTGTAETSDDKSVQTDAWFVGYIKDASAPYAVAVIVEQGGTGGSVAAPLAKKALSKAISLGLN